MLSHFGVVCKLWAGPSPSLSTHPRNVGNTIRECTMYTINSKREIGSSEITVCKIILKQGNIDVIEAWRSPPRSSNPDLYDLGRDPECVIKRAESKFPSLPILGWKTLCYYRRVTKCRLNRVKATPLVLRMSRSRVNNVRVFRSRDFCTDSHYIVTPFICKRCAKPHRQFVLGGTFYLRYDWINMSSYVCVGWKIRWPRCLATGAWCWLWNKRVFKAACL